ncbi:MAG TPA: glutamate racemase [Polyangia bacterium]|jgi:glutamate racemase
MSDAELAIGVFDSGVGGLTVVRALRQELPREHIIYLGDTARVPYGSKSPQTVLRYSRNNARFLLERGIKLLVIACNTASAFGLPQLAGELPVPVLGAVEPGAREAVAATRSGRLGVIGTLGTIRSSSYRRAIAAAAPALQVAVQACPLLVPLAEEGWTEGEVPRLTAQRYLADLFAQLDGIDTLVLGCTHYPLLRPILAEVARGLAGRDVTLVDSAGAMARATRAALDAAGQRRTAGEGRLECYVTDAARIAEWGPRFLGEPLADVVEVDIDVHGGDAPAVARAG